MKQKEVFTACNRDVVTILAMFVHCFIVTVLSGEKAHSQSLPNNIIKNTNPVSPEIASLGVYAMSSPNFANGLPSVHIPLFEIREHGLNYPLNIQYYSSGFRPTEEASSVGLGWMITQGIITRVVKGLPDDNPTVKKKFEDLYNLPPYEFLTIDLAARFGTPCHRFTEKKYDLLANRVYNKVYDGKPDEYIFNFNGYSGKFLWIKGEAMFLPHDNDLKISKIGDDFIVDTPDALRFTFKSTERAYSYVRGGESSQLSAIFYGADCGEGDGPITFDGNSGYISAWILTKIENKNTKRQIVFNYETYYHNEITTSTDYGSLNIWGYKYVCCGVGCARANQGFPYYSWSQGTETLNRTSNTLLKEIISDNHKIVIEYKSRVDFPPSKAVDKLKVYFKTDLLNPIKEISFFHEYFGRSPNTNSWLKLKKVLLKGGGENKEYKFDYENENEGIVSNKKNCKSIDHWGYYNQASNRVLFPKLPAFEGWANSGAFSFNLDIIPWANREPDFQYAKFYTLNKITYPTKGFTKYYYETAEGRGIRLRAAEDFDGNRVVKKYYEYEREAAIVDPAYMYDLNQFDVGDPSPCLLLMEAHTPCTQSDLPRRHITLSGHIKYALDYVDYSNFYPLVTEFIGSMDGKGGKIIYSFIRNRTGGKTFMTGMSKFAYGDSIPIEKTKITYDQHVLKTINYFGDPIYVNKSTYCVFDPVYNYALADFLFSPSSLASVWYKKTKEERILNSGNAVTTSVVENFYKEPDVVSGIPFTVTPTKVSLNTSDGDNKTTEYYFPGDVDPHDNANILGVAEMWNPSALNYKYMISEPVKVRISSKETVLNEIYFIYSYSSVFDCVLQTRFEEKASRGVILNDWYFTYTNNGLIKSIKKNQQPIESFMWGDDPFLPVAYAVNANDTEVFYEGFEGGNHSGVGYTGTSSFQGSYRVNFMPPNNRRYVYSYWYRANNTWHFSGINNYLNPITIANRERIDDVKVYPYDAKITTYTYQPLIGLTSKTDEKDMTTFFRYDQIGRLSNLTDSDGNVLESYTYSVKATFDEPTLYFNTQIQQAFTKNDCPVIDGELLTADPINYIVPANTFSSALSYEDAMDMARKDIEESGQTYANENCRCGVTVRVYDNEVSAKISVLRMTNTATRKIYTMPYGKKEMPLPPGNYNVEIQLSEGGLDTFGHIEMRGSGVSRVCYNNSGGDYFYFNANLSSSNGQFLLFFLNNGNCQ